jgi:hypothetical protein
MGDRVAREVTVELAAGVARWAYGGAEDDGSDAIAIEAPGGPLDVTDPLVHAAVTAAEAAGSLTITEGSRAQGVVQTEKQSLRRYDAAARARAPLYAERDRALRGRQRLPELVTRSREHVEELAADGSSLHRALLADAPDDQAEFAVPARSREDLEELAAAGSDYHAELLRWEDRMAQESQDAAEALEAAS